MTIPNGRRCSIKAGGRIGFKTSEKFKVDKGLRKEVLEMGG
jgi:hypothetical protein